MQNYNLTLLAPPGYVHYLAFAEVSLLLEQAFQTIGVNCTFEINNLQKDKINILLGYHLIKEPELLGDYKYIPYQLEQLSAKNGWFNETVLTILKNAYSIWDYSNENIAFMKQYGLSAKLLTIGYHDKLKRIQHDVNKDIDVLFYGCLNEHRKNILDQLIALGYRVKNLCGVYGQKRDEYIARAKLVLNIHFYDTQILEVVRISYLLNNKIFVLSEESPTNPYKDTGLVTVSYHNIVSECRKYLDNLKLIDETRELNYQRFKQNYQMSIFLDRVLRV
ncbi:MAG TPA: hypothetical protein DF296_13910 [Candidatus Margulisbacteria bacterium]|nr:MAG: hypothetical protein A2X43_07870 [Candidatus Margulisbacteria bacterium GWD2_39_127]OGI04690.1 MAG: hypothetical protein A2X42_11070 [Candidatus Margulisbacteria bacterium GWF2_38_17]HCT86282.1 hypothetical protein [Candidatus Margulisiibacteriota bacterium]